jgi:hypothetical protein
LLATRHVPENFAQHGQRCECLCACLLGGGCRSAVHGTEGDGAHGRKWHIARTAGIQQPDCV